MGVLSVCTVTVSTRGRWLSAAVALAAHSWEPSIAMLLDVEPTHQRRPMPTPSTAFRRSCGSTSAEFSHSSGLNATKLVVVDRGVFRSQRPWAPLEVKNKLY